MEISQKLLCLLCLVSAGAGVIMGLFYDVLYMTRVMCGLHIKKQCVSTCPECDQHTDVSCATRKKSVRLHSAFSSVVLFVEDVIFFLVCGVCVVLILYFVNDGQFRFFVPLGLASGFFVYKMTVGRLVRALLEVLVGVVHKALGFLIACLYRVLDFVLLRRVRKAWQTHREKKLLVKTKEQINQLLRETGNCFGLFDNDILT